MRLLASLILLVVACTPLEARRTPCNVDADCGAAERCSDGLCALGERPPGPDAGTPPARDAGLLIEDAGPPTFDDAGAVPVDAGAADSGVPLDDAGAPELDAGPVLPLPAPDLAVSFDDAFGGRSYATAPAAHPLRLEANAAPLTAGVRRGGLSFAGAAAVIDYPPPFEEGGVHQRFSVCLWVRAAANGGIQALYQVGGATNGLALIFNGAGELGMGIRRNDTFIPAPTTTTVDPSRFVFVCGTVSPEETVVYVDGERAGEGAGTSVNLGTAGHVVGANNRVSVIDATSDGSRFELLVGDLDELQVWLDTTLTEAEVTAAMSAKIDGPGPRYAFGMELAGAAGMANLGHAGGAATLVGTAEVDGVNGSALEFIAQSDALNVGYLDEDLPASANHSAVTLSAWVNSANLAGKRTVYQVGGNNNCAAIVVENGFPTFTMRAASDAVTVRSAFSLQPGVWTHLTGTGDGESLRVVVDGVSSETPSNGQIWNTGTDGHRVGRINQAGNSPTSCLDGAVVNDTQPFRGAIDDARLYTYSLTDAEIAEDAQRAAP